MPLKLDIKKVLSARSDRVKSVDFHPTEPWVLAGLYSGTVMIWDYQTQALVRQMEVSNLPIRCAKFLVRRQWILVGCDDMTIKVLNYNTLEKIHEIENAHTDYIRYLCVHPTLPIVLSSSDDMSIKTWDWEKSWTNTNVFEGHSHYVMMVQWNPKDNTSFASASLDRSIKIWGLSGTAHFTLTGHTRGVNCVDYTSAGDKPYLVSGSDDKTVRVWDYQTKQCVHVLEGHTANVSCVMFHPSLPIILTGSEDGLCKIWHSTTYKLESSLNYMLERLWSIALLRGTNSVALGYDEGTVVVKLGSDEPVVSFNGGKIVWAKGVDIQTVNLKTVAVEEDGEIVSSLPIKDMGACELFPQQIAHHPSGRLFAVCGDGEYVIYTAQALRNKSFGHALGFAWSPEGHYATRDASGRISIFHNFKEAFAFKPDFHIEEIHSGHLLAIRSADFVVFYDWNEYRVIRRIDVACTNLYWSESAAFVALACTDSLFVLAHDKEAVIAATAGGANPDEGIEIAFELHNEVNETVKSGVWVSDSCFVFINDKMKLCTLVGGQVEVLAHVDRALTVLGYMPEHARIYTIDKALNVSSFELQLALIQYKSAIVCGDLGLAESIFAQLPENLHTKIARFLESQGYKAEALEISKDVEHKFELALSMGRLELATEFVSQIKGPTFVQHRLIGDKALDMGALELAEKSFLAANDCESLLLIASASGDQSLLQSIVTLATAQGNVNVELMARTLLGDKAGCVETLLRSEKYFEAVLFAKTYCPSLMDKVFPIWKSQVLEPVNPQLAKHIDIPNLGSEIEIENIIEKYDFKNINENGFIEDFNQLGHAAFEAKLSKSATKKLAAPRQPKVKSNAPVILPQVAVTAPVVQVPLAKPVMPFKAVSDSDFESPSSSRDEMMFKPPPIVPARQSVSPRGNISAPTGPPQSVSPRANISAPTGPPQSVSPRANISAPTGPPQSVSPRANTSAPTGPPQSVSPRANISAPTGPPQSATMTRPTGQSQSVSPTSAVSRGPPQSVSPTSAVSRPSGPPSAMSPPSLRGPPGPPRTLSGPPRGLAGPPRGLSGPPSTIRAAPEVASPDEPESQRPVPHAPESTDDHDLL